MGVRESLGGWPRWVQALALVGGVFGIPAGLLTVAWYIEEHPRPLWTRYLSWYLDALRQHWPLALRVLVGLVTCAVAVHLVRKFRRQLVRLFKWFTRQMVRPFKWLAGIAKRFYLWLLWQLVIRPARDHLGQEAVSAEHLERALSSISSEMRDQMETQAERERVWDMRTQSLVAEQVERARLSLTAEMSEQMEALLERERDSTPTRQSVPVREARELSVFSAQLLLRLLDLYRHQPGDTVFMRTPELETFLAQSAEADREDLERACNELLAADILVKVE